MAELMVNQGDKWTVPCTQNPKLWYAPELFTRDEQTWAKNQCRRVCSRRINCIREALVPDKNQSMASQGIWAGEMFPGTFDEALNSTIDRLLEIYKVLTRTDAQPPGFKHRRRPTTTPASQILPPEKPIRRPVGRPRKARPLQEPVRRKPGRPRKNPPESPPAARHATQPPVHSLANDQPAQADEHNTNRDRQITAPDTSIVGQPLDLFPISA